MAVAVLNEKPAGEVEHLQAGVHRGRL